jgi:hypothetical protein
MGEEMSTTRQREREREREREGRAKKVVWWDKKGNKANKTNERPR